MISMPRYMPRILPSTPGPDWHSSIAISNKGSSEIKTDFLRLSPRIPVYLFACIKLR